MAGKREIRAECVQIHVEGFVGISPVPPGSPPPHARPAPQTATHAPPGSTARARDEDNGNPETGQTDEKKNDGGVVAAARVKRNMKTTGRENSY